MTDDQFKELIEKLSEIVKAINDNTQALNGISNRIEDIGATL